MSLSRMELKNIKSLLTKKGRRSDQMFLAEGIRLMEECFLHKFLPDKVLYTPALLSDRGFSVLDKLSKKKINSTQISLSHMNTISDTKSPQGIVGIFNTPDQKLKEPYPANSRNILVCENISDPGNLGTLLRSALAFDFGMTIMCGDCVEVFSPKVIRSTAGAVFGIKIFKATINELKSFMEKTKGVAIAAILEGDSWQTNKMKIKNADNRLLMVGSEADGLSHDMKKQSKIKLRIEHTGKVESLNAAVAGSIIMKQVYDL